MPSTILPHYVLCADGDGLRRALDRGGLTPFIANSLTIGGHYLGDDGRPICGAAVGSGSDVFYVGPLVRCRDCGPLLVGAGKAVEISRRDARRISAMVKAAGR